MDEMQRGFLVLNVKVRKGPKPGKKLVIDVRRNLVGFDFAQTALFHEHMIANREVLGTTWLAWLCWVRAVAGTFEDRQG
jgi:hypothetical protein